MQYLQDVHAFQKKFNIPTPSCPAFPEESVVSFRLDFLREELEEIEDGVMTRDMAAVLDGLVDLVYVALGTALMFGLDFDQAWQRVQEANMKKIAGLPTGRHGTFDVTKPVGWRSPVLDDLVDPSHERLVP